MILHPYDCQSTMPIGGKAHALASLTHASFPVPEWFAVTAGEFTLPPLSDLSAVRSSAMAEDGAEHSYAGQYESFLNVAPADVPEKIAQVRESSHTARVTAYAQHNDHAGEVEVAVIVQRMVDAAYAGVAFGADPVTGERDICLISAVAGLGEALVSGETDSENWRVDRQEHITGDSSLLTPEQVRAIASLCRRCDAHFGRPQDIEWAIDQEGTLWLLQSRPITTLATQPDPADELIIWDNSNIAESYGGVTTPLTFSFASRVYEHVYREFCHLLSVPAWKIRKNDHVFPQMLGLIRGRTYYHLVSWYRVLALLPGFTVNRSFMEKMMGVKKPLPKEVVTQIISENTTSRWRDILALVKTTAGLVRSYWRLPAQISKFQKRLDSALALDTPLSTMRREELITHYRELEERLLHRWDAPLVNDFFAMIFYGIFSKKCDQANELLQDTGDIISARPPRLIKEMAALTPPALAKLMVDPELTLAKKLRALREEHTLYEKFTDYLAEFGDRCLEELKLESPTLHDDPSSLLLAIGGFALRPAGDETPLRKRPSVKGFLRRWLLKRTQTLVRHRENLRFERTRVFGRVRQVLRELGKRLVADGQLEQVDDVFYLELDEVLETSMTLPYRALAAVRREEFSQYRDSPAPPDRFHTRGALHRHVEFTSEELSAEASGDLQGVGACPGIVRGPVRVVTDPREAQLQPGEILVATQTDPGWVVLFPAAAGLLVERGSLLSHSAIVARELNLPCIVSLSQITQTLKTGDLIEMNGQTGHITLLES